MCYTHRTLWQLFHNYSLGGCKSGARLSFTISLWQQTDCRHWKETNWKVISHCMLLLQIHNHNRAVLTFFFSPFFERILNPAPRLAFSGREMTTDIYDPNVKLLISAEHKRSIVALMHSTSQSILHTNINIWSWLEKLFSPSSHEHLECWSETRMFFFVCFYFFQNVSVLIKGFTILVIVLGSRCWGSSDTFIIMALMICREGVSSVSTY